MQYLKLSTAATVIMGPFVDNADGVTPETGLAAGTVDEIGIYKHDATALTSIAGTTTFTHRAGGMYTMTLSVTDTNTVGRMTAYVRDDSVCLPVWKDFMVLAANVYDALTGADYLYVDALEISSDATAANNAELAFDGTGFGFTGCTMPTTTTVTNMVSANVTQISGDSTAADNAELAYDGTGFGFTGCTMPTTTTVTNRVTANTDQIEGVDATNQIGDAVWDEALAGHVAAGSAGKALSDISAAGIADAVWDEQLAGHTAVGSAGEAQAGSRVADYIWDEVLETNAPAIAQTARQWMRIIMSALVGETAGAGDWSAMSIDGSKTRIQGTLTAAGARSSVDTLDGS